MVSCSKWLTGIFYKLDCFYSFIQKGTKWTKEMYRGKKTSFCILLLNFYLSWQGLLTRCWPVDLDLWGGSNGLHCRGTSLVSKSMVLNCNTNYSSSTSTHCQALTSISKALFGHQIPDWFLVNVSKISGLKPEAFLMTLLYSFHRENYSLPPVFYLPTSSTI